MLNFQRASAQAAPEPVHSPPVVERYEGISVVRDDLFVGGTKGRILGDLFSKYDEIVYATSALSCTQIALASAAKVAGKTATLFIAGRRDCTAQTKLALELGASVHEVSAPAYLSVVRAKAAAYAKQRGAYLAPLGFDTPAVIKRLADVAGAADLRPDEVWCAAGSGVLTRALQLAWPEADHFAVLVGKKDCDAGRAHRIVYPKPFNYAYQGEVPFPSERHFDAKAWEVCKCEHGSGAVVFWNVLGDVSDLQKAG